MGNFNVKRRCPKCGGNMYLDKDHYGWYEQCLQCSFVSNLKVVYQEKEEVVQSGIKGNSLEKEG